MSCALGLWATLAGESLSVQCLGLAALSLGGAVLVFWGGRTVDCRQCVDRIELASSFGRLMVRGIAGQSALETDLDLRIGAG